MEKGSLKGIVVLDFTRAWAGPMATRILAVLGARVIKIESPSTHLDSWRGSYRGRGLEDYPDCIPGDTPYNRDARFNTQNTDKLSIGLNLKVDTALDVARRLAQRADVVVANFASGVMERLGLGYLELQELRRDIIMVEMPAFGNSGPFANHSGMGQTMESFCGMASLMGYGDGVPVLTGEAYLDPIGGLHGAMAVIAALEFRRRTGLGQYVELAQVEAALHWIGEELACVAAGDALESPNGNRVRGELIHDAFPCSGEDEWVAIACTSVAEWEGLCSVLNMTGDDAGYVLPMGFGEDCRLEDVVAKIRQWTMHIDKHSAAALLQAAGVRAAPVNNGKDVAKEPNLWSREFYSDLEHPKAGRHWYPGLGIHVSDRPQKPMEAAPCFGADGPIILKEIGYSEAEIRLLLETGALATEPIA